MIKIWEPSIILPPILEGDPRLRAAKRALNEQLRLLSHAVNQMLLLPRLDELPEEIVDLLATQYHVDFYEPLDLSLESKRELVRDAIAWHRRKGTKAAVEEIVKHVFPSAKVKEWFEYDGEPYKFQIETPTTVEETDRVTLNRLRQAVKESKNARSWLEFFAFIMDLDDVFKEVVDANNMTVELFRGDEYDMNGLADCDGDFLFDGETDYGSARDSVALNVKPTVDDEYQFPTEITYDGGFDFDGGLTVSDDVPDCDGGLMLDGEAGYGGEVNHGALIDYGGEIPKALSFRVQIKRPSDAMTTPVEGGHITVKRVLAANYDGKWDYDGGLSADGEDVVIETITDDEYGDDYISEELLAEWNRIHTALQREFDEECPNCGATTYEWHRSSVRLGGDTFLLSDPQWPTVLIKCANCGTVIAEFLVTDERAEVRL